MGSDIFDCMESLYPLLFLVGPKSDDKIFL